MVGAALLRQQRHLPRPAAVLALGHRGRRDASPPSPSCSSCCRPSPRASAIAVRTAPGSTPRPALEYGHPSCHRRLRHACLAASSLAALLARLRDRLPRAPAATPSRRRRPRTGTSKVRRRPPSSSRAWSSPTPAPVTVQVLDLITEKVSPRGARSAGVRGLTTDGRFAYLGTASRHARRRQRRLDGRPRRPRALLPRDDPRRRQRRRASGRGTSTAIRPSPPSRFQDGTIRLLRPGQAGGRLDRRGPHAGRPDDTRPGRSVPGASPGSPATGSRQDVRRGARPPRRGDAVARTEPCPQVRGEAVTRRGVVFGCADGALLVTARRTARSPAEKIPYGVPVADRDRAERLPAPRRQHHADGHVRRRRASGFSTSPSGAGRS